MSRFEERAFRTSRQAADASQLANQLARLQSDLEQYMARRPDGPMVAPLRQRIADVKLALMAAKNHEERVRAAKKAASADAGEGGYAPRRASPEGATGSPGGAGRFPPRRRSP